MPAPRVTKDAMSFARFKTTTPPTTPAATAVAATTPPPAQPAAATPAQAAAVGGTSGVAGAAAPSGFAAAKANPPAATKPATSTGLVVPAMLAKSTLALIAKDDEKGTFADMFPTLQIKGGNAGGTMVPTDGTDKEVAKLLPQGKMPIQGVFMAYRSEAIAWPTDYDNKKEGDRPCINCAIQANDNDNTGLLLTGSENFQFAPSEVKLSKWAFKNGGPGYLRPVFQILLYLPQFDDCIVLQASGLLKTYRAMAQQLIPFVNEQDGSLAPFPATFDVTTEPWYDDNVFHYWKISGQMNAQGAEAHAKYQAFVASIQANRPDLVQNITDWYTGADKPISSDQLERLKMSANMVNPRRRRS